MDLCSVNDAAPPGWQNLSEKSPRQCCRRTGERERTHLPLAKQIHRQQCLYNMYFWGIFYTRHTHGTGTSRFRRYKTNPPSCLHRGTKSRLLDVLPGGLFGAVSISFFSPTVCESRLSSRNSFQEHKPDLMSSCSARVPVLPGTPRRCRGSAPLPAHVSHSGAPALQTRQAQRGIIETIPGHYTHLRTFGGICICEYIRSVELHLHGAGRYLFPGKVLPAPGECRAAVFVSVFLREVVG